VNALIASLAGPLRVCVVCAFLLATACSARAGESESPGHVILSDGSLIHCMIGHAVPWTIKSVGGIQTLKLSAVDSIQIGERVDPNVENDALVAVGDLQNAAYDVREKAESKLRSLGRGAAKPLKQAASSADVEVSKRARALLAEMGAVEDSGIAQDRVKLRDGTTVTGDVDWVELSVRSRFGRLRIPIEALERIVFSNDPTAAQEGDSFPALSSPEIAVPLPVAGHVENASARAWDPNEEAATDPAALNGWLLEAQRNALTMDKITDPNDPKASVPTKAGDKLDDVYSERGVLLHATDAGGTVEASGDAIQGFSAGRSLITKKSDLEFRFVLPKTKGAVNAGVLHVGAVVRTEGPGSMGIAAYDAAGRLLAQIMNSAPANAPPGAAGRDQFLGITSKTPIARVRIFRGPELKAKGGNVQLDDIIFDRIAAAGMRADQCGVVLVSGDRLVGKAVEAPAESIAIRAEFLGDKAEPLTIKLSAVAFYEPARGVPVDPVAKSDEQPKPRRFSLAHGVLLQSGETFRAHLFALDEKIAVFGLARGAMLKLPRETLRKIELIPEPTPPGEAPSPTVVGKDEKPGVASKTKPQFNNPAAPLPKEEKKDPDKNPAQGVAFQEAEIVSVDPDAHELTIKDDLGPMTVGLATIKALIFPPNPNANAQAKKRGWILTLREGSRFEADVLKITPTDISAEMAGGLVVLPVEAVELVGRK